MRVIKKIRFYKSYKKLPANDRKVVDKTIQYLLGNLEAGEKKKHNLSGVYVYKFRINRQQVLLAYSWNKEDLILFDIGSHENFYRDLAH
jgi:mRNA-degrading endonuclease RelE of RelBE toxin-antitoxin system